MSNVETFTSAPEKWLTGDVLGVIAAVQCRRCGALVAPRHAEAGDDDQRSTLQRHEQMCTAGMPTVVVQAARPAPTPDHDPASSTQPDLAEPPWDEIDPGIRGVVATIYEAGFQTIASCQGHGEGDAWVAIAIEPHVDIWLEAGRLADLLSLHGWNGSAIVEAAVELVGPRRWLRVRWWGQVPFR